MSAELTEVTRERMYNVMEIGELKAQLTKQKQATENCEAMLSRMVEERNAAVAREEEARSALLGTLNANRKIRKRTDTDVAFTREYSRVSIFHRERECTN